MQFDTLDNVDFFYDNEQILCDFVNSNHIFLEYSKTHTKLMKSIQNPDKKDAFAEKKQYVAILLTLIQSMRDHIKEKKVIPGQLTVDYTHYKPLDISFYEEYDLDGNFVQNIYEKKPGFEFLTHFTINNKKMSPKTAALIRLYRSPLVILNHLLNRKLKLLSTEYGSIFYISPRFTDYLQELHIDFMIKSINTYMLDPFSLIVKKDFCALFISYLMTCHDVDFIKSYETYDKYSRIFDRLDERFSKNSNLQFGLEFILTGVNELHDDTIFNFKPKFEPNDHDYVKEGTYYDTFNKSIEKEILSDIHFFDNNVIKAALSDKILLDLNNQEAFKNGLNDISSIYLSYWQLLNSRVMC